MRAVVVAYVAIPALLGWFTYATIDAAGGLKQANVRLPTENSYDPYLDDFVVFYSAGTMTREGKGGDIYNVSAIRDQEARAVEQLPGDTLPLPFFNPPAVVLPLAVLSALPLMAAAGVWTAAGLLAMCASGVGLIRGRHAKPDSILIVTWIVGITSTLPFYQTLVHGQISFFLFAGWALLWLGAFAQRDNRVAIPGLLLLSLKPQFLLLPIVCLALQRRWRLLAEFVACLGLLTGASLLILGPAVLPDYVHLLTSAAGWDERNGISTWGMFGWNAFTKALLPNAEGARLVATLVLDVATIVVVVKAVRSRLRSGAHEEAFATLVFGSLLISPHFYAHDVLIALVPILLLAISSSRTNRTRWALYAATGWLLLYFHFDILAPTNLNASSLWLACGLLAAAYPQVPAAIHAAASLMHPGSWLRRSIQEVDAA